MHPKTSIILTDSYKTITEMLNIILHIVYLHKNKDRNATKTKTEQKTKQNIITSTRDQFKNENKN